MKTVVRRAAEALGRLALDGDARAEALREMVLAGAKPERLDSLHEEWALDLLVSSGGRVSGAEVRDFPGWLRARLAEPFRVPLHRMSRVRSEWGEELSMRCARLYWPAAVEWARAARRGDDDPLACLGHAWLVAAAQDPGRQFVRHAGFCARLLCTGAPGIAEQAFPGDASSDGLPAAWEAMARQAYGDRVDIDAGRLSALARACRRAGEAEDAALSRRERADQLLAQAPHLRITALTAAAEMGLSSDDVLRAMSAFLALPPPPEGGMPASRLLSRTFPSHAGTSPEPEGEERARRIEVVRSLDASWPLGIPADWKGMMDGRAAHPETCAAWVAEVVAGRRTPPLDPLLDYGLWLVERR